MSLDQSPAFPLTLLVQLTFGLRLGGYLSTYLVNGRAAYAAAASELSLATS